MINLLLASADAELTADELIAEAVDSLFEGLTSQLGFAILYTVVALAVLGLAVALLMYRFRRDRLNDYAKVAFGVVAGLAIMATVLMAVVTFYQINNYDGGSPKELFQPILALVCVAIGGGCLMGIASFFNKFAVKVAAIITGAGLLGATRYFETSQSEWYPSLSTTGLVVSMVIGILILGVAFFFGKKATFSDTRSIVYGAIAIAMSFALSYARFIHLPQGGSVTFASLLPLMIYCCMFGTRRGIVVCLIYGCLQALQDTYIIHPVQFLLDYPLAFGMIGVSGFFCERTPLKKNKLIAFIVGAVIAVVLRYACHICSGVFAFADYADLETYDTAIAYSFAYNSFTMHSADRWTSPPSPPKAWRTTSPTRTRTMSTPTTAVPMRKTGRMPTAKDLSDSVQPAFFLSERRRSCGVFHYIRGRCNASPAMPDHHV